LRRADPDVIDIALERIDGNDFEDFALQYFPALLGAEFSPLGGMHDGGADGFGGDRVYERTGRETHFIQASVQADVKAKMRSTYKRLKEFGRDVSSITLLTSRVVPTVDVVEDSLSEELGAMIRIRDGSYIRSHANDTSATVAAYEKYLLPETDFLRRIGTAGVLGPSQLVTDPTVFVFLRQEVDKLDGNVLLVDSISDALILWALEGTDPDADKLMTKQKIEATVPSASAMIAERLDERLRSLSSKDYPGGRQIRWHRSEDAYVLPYDTRRDLASENASDEALRLRVLQSFTRRATHMYLEADETAVRRIAEVSLRSLQVAFEQEGLEFAHFVSHEDVAVPQMRDAVRQAVQECGATGPESVRLAAACLAVARECFYHGTVDERDYLGRLARTYTLLFTLRNEPRLVEYFSRMSADFYLYVGSDMLVQALSERFLPVENQHARNTLQMAADAGATLVLTEPVVEEVLGNLRASDNEFRNQIEVVEHRLTRDMMREVPKILVRAYLYNRDAEAGPSNWPAFVEQFCSYSSLHEHKAETDLRRYLQASFRMEYLDRETLTNLADEDAVASLTRKLLEVKANIELASNDALLVAAVYGHRLAGKETGEANEFGFRTWWLTNETSILRQTVELEARHDGARYIMRPDFLLNFFTFAPSAAQVRSTYANVFPSALGVQLSRRMDEASFHAIMRRVREAESLDDGRRLAVMAECADRLKSDFSRRYVIEMDSVGTR
jgi:hypothetical protein